MTMNERYRACMILHAVGDTVGYKNSEWEFKRGGYEIINEKLYEFIALGGVNGISLKGWHVSDDTILHIKIAQALVEKYDDINTLNKNITNKFIDALEQFTKEGNDLRNPGLTTIKIIQKLKNGMKWDETPYDLFSGGSGASMRTACIGLAYPGEDNRYKLIQIAIESSRITHNSVVGYLGGLVAALFTAFAIENVRINEWPFLLLNMLETGKIEKYLTKTGRDIGTYQKDSHIFIDKLKQYIEYKFDSNKNVIERRSSMNLLFRSQYYLETYGFKPEQRRAVKTDAFEQPNKPLGFIGSGGDDSIIIAYDSLIDSKDNWEKLCVYSMMHIGDTDTTGCIAAAWYGAMYGFKNVPENFTEHLEYKKELERLGNELFKKYN